MNAIKKRRFNMKIFYFLLILLRAKFGEADSIAVSIENVPYQVSIVDFSFLRNGHFMCEGAILNKRHVLTYSKCAHEQLLFGVKVRAGSISPYEGGSLHDVISYLAYSYEYDMSPSVIKVKQEFEYGNLCQPVRLSSTIHIKFGTWANVTSFRRSMDNKPMITRNQCEIIETKVCFREIPITKKQFNGKSVLCTRQDFPHPITQSTGALAIINGVLVGLCRGGYMSKYALYVNMGYYVDWITYRMNE